MKKILKCLFLLNCFLFYMQPIMGAPLSYEGSSSIGGELLPELAKAFEKKEGISFGEIKSTDSNSGFKAVKEGRSPIGGLSRFLTAEEMKAELPNKVIGYDAVVVYINKDNPIQNFTSEQLKKIFKNQLTNWKDLGWADTPIYSVLKDRGEEGGTARQFIEIVMGGEDFATPSLRLPTYKEVVATVASNPAAIAFASLAYDEEIAKPATVDSILPSREALNKGEYPLARPYVLVYRENPENPELEKFFEFIFSKEGQAIIKKYVVPVMEFQDQ